MSLQEACVGRGCLGRNDTRPTPCKKLGSDALYGAPVRSHSVYAQPLVHHALQELPEVLMIVTAARTITKILRLHILRPSVLAFAPVRKGAAECVSV